MGNGSDRWWVVGGRVMRRGGRRKETPAMSPGAKGAHSHGDGLHTRSYPADCEGWKSDEKGGEKLWPSGLL
jgi:hypothetical protein